MSCKEIYDLMLQDLKDMKGKQCTVSEVAEHIRDLDTFEKIMGKYHVNYKG